MHEGQLKSSTHGIIRVSKMSYLHQRKARDDCDNRLYLLRSRHPQMGPIFHPKRGKGLQLDTSSSDNDEYEHYKYQIDFKENVRNKQKFKTKEITTHHSRIDNSNALTKQYVSLDTSISRNIDYPTSSKRRFSSSSGSSSGGYNVTQPSVSKTSVKQMGYEQKPSYVCDICLVSVNSKQSLIQHIRGASHIRKTILSKEYSEKIGYIFSNTRRSSMDEVMLLNKRCSNLERENMSLRYELDILQDLKIHSLPNEETNSIQNEDLRNQQPDNRLPSRFVSSYKIAQCKGE